MTKDLPSDEGWYWFAKDIDSEPFPVFVDIEGNVIGVTPDGEVLEFLIEEGGIWLELLQPW